MDANIEVQAWPWLFKHFGVDSIDEIQDLQVALEFDDGGADGDEADIFLYTMYHEVRIGTVYIDSSIDWGFYVIWHKDVEPFAQKLFGEMVWDEVRKLF